MQMSDSTQNIFSAIAKMQSELQNVTKNKNGHSYKYADLAQCLEVAKEPLANNGLAVVQLMGMGANNETTLTTMITHESGEYIRSEFIMERAVLQGGAGKNPAQNMGASITYMRRYAFAAIIGMAQEDSDAANNNGKTPPQPRQQQTPPPPVRQLPDELNNALQMASNMDELKDAYQAHTEKAKNMGYEQEFKNAVTARSKELGEKHA